MRRILLFVLIIMFASLVVLTGCSDDKATKEKEQKKIEQTETETETKQSKNDNEKTAETEKKNVPEAAVKPEAMVMEGPGKLFTASDMDEMKLKKAIESLPGDLSADEAYNYLIHLMAADYGGALKKYEEFNPSFIVDGAPKGEKNQESNEEEKELHVALLMDASGSMGAYVNGEMKMKAAKDSLKQFVSSLSDDSKVLLRVYGHKGTGSDADKKMSCSSTEVVYPLSNYDKGKFEKALSEFKPAGWTPLAASINAAKEDLQGYSGETIKNVVYIISDGEETCGGDPVKAAKQLHESGIATAVNIIGFDVGNKAQQQLKKVAEAGGGTFTNVDSGESLLEAAESNIDEALEAAELNMWSALEGVDLTWDAIHKNDDLDAIASNFDDVIGRENDLLQSGLDGLNDTGKISEEEAERLESLIDKRQDKIEFFNDNKEKILEREIEKEKQKASDIIDRVRKKRASQ